MRTLQQMENVKQWVQALRSGEYHQGHGRLKNADEYCCLGVLCDIQKDLKFDIEDRVVGGISNNRPWAHAIDAEFFEELTGFTRQDHDIFASLNDDSHFTFEQLANVIDAMNTFRL